MLFNTTVSNIAALSVFQVAPPRYLQMKQDQDWTSVWPTAASFKWSVVPLPLRQGFAEVAGLQTVV